ncbi:putative glutamate synthase (NADPH) small subunit [Commensalibacter intestini A911]|uniref:Putative glutamate synthase (NADPH) small subunit n=2 Tax=Commensalibacter intestini TaxID=479936 RepID=G6F1H9_9PROT|nr:putative glutamate synthase (NADPH) small subunit [Commensalibacter intestini A911]
MEKKDFAGPVRTVLPVYNQHLPPCNNACPAGEDIQGWLALAQAGKFQEAWEHILMNNPMPAVHGRACYHPCEDSCNRGDLDGSVSIHAVERFLGDMANASGWKVPVAENKNSKRILIIGAGPGGLSAAYHLRRMGHEVEIREAYSIPGGMMQYGIPAYRLPRDILQQDIERIKEMGVKIVCNHRVDDLEKEKQEGNFDAVFLGIGAGKPSLLDIPTQDGADVVSAVEFLHDVSAGKEPKVGANVLVYGAGNTAMDAARSAFRMGAKNVTIIFFWDRPHMEAHDFEIVDADAEGTKFKCMSTIASIEKNKVVLRKMVVGATGRPEPTEEFEDMPMDTVIMALGQRPQSSFLEVVQGIIFNPDGTIVVGPDMMTGAEGVFAGGDAIRGPRSVTTAVGLGKKAARFINGWLNGEAYVVPSKNPISYYKDLHLPLLGDTPQTIQKELPVAERIAFKETLIGFSENEAVYEAQRCLSCGNCYECDNCLAACPEQALTKLGPGNGYEVNMDRCTGCSACFETCPCQAIDMVTEHQV